MGAVLDGQVERRWRMSEGAGEKEYQRHKFVERTGSGQVAGISQRRQFEYDALGST